MIFAHGERREEDEAVCARSIIQMYSLLQRGDDGSCNILFV